MTHESLIIHLLIATAAALAPLTATAAAEPAATPAASAAAPAVRIVAELGATVEHDPALIGSVAYVVTRQNAKEIDDAAPNAAPAGQLTAVNLVSGQPSWRFDFEGRAAAAPVATMRSVLLTTLDGHVLAIDRLTGRLRWRFDTGQRLYAAVGPADPEGCACRNIFRKVVVATGEGDVICLDSRSGKLIWRQRGTVRINAAPARWDDKLLLADCEGQLRALALADGRELFSLALPGPVGGSPLVIDQTAVIATATGAMVGVDLAERRLAWARTLAEGAVLDDTPLAAAALAVTAADDQGVHALDAATGKPAWHAALNDAPSAGPVLAPGGLLLAEAGGRLVLLNTATGRQGWSYDLGENAVGLAATPNQAVFVTPAGRLGLCR